MIMGIDIVVTSLFYKANHSTGTKPVKVRENRIHSSESEAHKNED